MPELAAGRFFCLALYTTSNWETDIPTNIHYSKTISIGKQKLPASSSLYPIEEELSVEKILSETALQVGARFEVMAWLIRCSDPQPKRMIDKFLNGASIS